MKIYAKYIVKTVYLRLLCKQNLKHIIIMGIVLLSLLLLALIPGFIASKKGRSFIGWYIFSVLLSPLIGLIVVLCLGESDEKRRERIIEEEKIRNSVRNE